MSQFIHIVCLDAPSPPDYGGAIDLFYKIKALAQTGKKIILHYFEYNPLRNANGLEEDCVAIYTYKRKSFFHALPLTQPFIVGSRINKELIAKLNGDNHPILLEGLHCSGIIPFINNPQRIVLRMHNDEASYYHHLAQTEKKVLKYFYFLQESKLLHRYQKILSKELRLSCLSEKDMDVFKRIYGFQNVHFIPCFIPWQSLSIKQGSGDYCLYHGNMSVSENEAAALWLIHHIFSKTEASFLVAGKDISKKLKEVARVYPNIKLVNNPSITEIDILIQNAQINALPSVNNTGVKLKLLNALLNGRHCITNLRGVKGSGIENGVFVMEEPKAWIEQINTLMQREFSTQDAEARKAVLQLYNNRQNAEALSALW